MSKKEKTKEKRMDNGGRNEVLLFKKDGLKRQL